jgi:hypothetical protein
LPPGEYIARIVGGVFATAKTGTPSYKLTFQVVEGKQAGRLIWHDLFLTEAALPMAKRDLGKLGVTSLAQLDQPLPPGIECKVRLALHRGDDGTERNRVVRFDVLRIEPPEPDAFAPDDDADEDQVADHPRRNGKVQDSCPVGANAGPRRQAGRNKQDANASRSGRFREGS